MNWNRAGLSEKLKGGSSADRWAGADRASIVGAMESREPQTTTQRTAAVTRLALLTVRHADPPSSLLPPAT